MKFYLRHPWGMGSKRYGTEFWFWHLSGCHGNQMENSLNISMSCVNNFKHLLLQNYQAESYEILHIASLEGGLQTIQNGILIGPLVWLLWQLRKTLFFFQLQNILKANYSQTICWISIFLQEIITRCPSASVKKWAWWNKKQGCHAHFLIFGP